MSASKSSHRRPLAARVPRGRPAGRTVECRTAGTHILWPKAIEERYNISKTTRWLWEQQGKLPPRDVYVGGRPMGWKPETIERAEAGPSGNHDEAA